MNAKPADLVNQAIKSKQAYAEITPHLKSLMRSADTKLCKPMISEVKKIIKDRKCTPGQKLLALDLFQECMMLKNPNFLQFAQSKILDRLTILAEKKSNDLFRDSSKSPENHQASEEFIQHLLSYIQIWASQFGRTTNGEPTLFSLSFTKLSGKVNFPMAKPQSRPESIKVQEPYRPAQPAVRVEEPIRRVSEPARRPEEYKSTGSKTSALVRANNAAAEQAKAIDYLENLLAILEEMGNPHSDETGKELVLSMMEVKPNLDSMLNDAISNDDQAQTDKLLTLNDRVQRIVDMKSKSKKVVEKKKPDDGREMFRTGVIVREPEVRVSTPKKQEVNIFDNILDLDIISPPPKAQFNTYHPSGASILSSPPNNPFDFPPPPMQMAPVFGMPNSSEIPKPGSGIPVIPASGFPLPPQGIPMPSSKISVPSPGIPVPSSGIPVPPSGIPVPQSGIPMPSSGIPMPSSGIPVPSSGIPVPFPGIPVPSPINPSNPSVPSGIPPVPMPAAKLSSSIPEPPQSALKHQVDPPQDHLSSIPSPPSASSQELLALKKALIEKEEIIEKLNLNCAALKAKNESLELSLAQAKEFLLSKEKECNEFHVLKKVEVQKDMFEEILMSPRIRASIVKEPIVESEADNEAIFKRITNETMFVVFDNEVWQMGVQFTSDPGVVKLQSYIGNKSPNDISELNIELEIGSQFEITISQPSTTLIQAAKQVNFEIFSTMPKLTYVYPRLRVSFLYCSELYQFSVKIPISMCRYSSPVSLWPDSIWQEWEDLMFNSESSQCRCRKSIKQVCKLVKLSDNLKILNTRDVKSLTKTQCLVVAFIKEIVIVLLSINDEEKICEIEARSNDEDLRKNFLMLMAGHIAESQ